ncbi:MAG: hypothetical protein ACLPN6_17325 [Streptosporangiaceae bacterium]|jgi:hypothetical protein|nr:hypothetical protein [Actinomycetota bacterium]
MDGHRAGAPAFQVASARIRVRASSDLAPAATAARSRVRGFLLTGIPPEALDLLDVPLDGAALAMSVPAGMIPA